MNSLTDSQLLRDYAERRSETAFAELVRRHVDLVYTAALRMVCDSHLAQDVTQGAFMALARSAPQLTERAVLSGWLHRTAQNIAAQTVRTDVRRRAREQEAAAMNELLTHEPDAAWEHIAPHLDTALGELSESDRDALLLRYFERKSAHEMAQTLGISDEAAQKRVNRAVERLREFFAKRGVTVGASSLAVVISANAVQAAPIGLAVTISTAAALAGTAIVTSAIATKAAISTMNWINMKTITAVLASALAAGTGTYLVKQRETNRLRTENQTLVAQHESTAIERDAALSAARTTKDELERSRKDEAELLRLRGEVGQMRRQLESQKAQARQQPAGVKTAEPAVTPPGAYIAKEQLAHVGYATPEAALQTITWAMMKGTYEQVNEGLSAQTLAGEQKDPKGREGFEARQKVMVPLFKGFQITARKLLADDKVELKIRMDTDPKPDQQRQLPPFMIQPMVKVGELWKLGGSTREHQDTWEKDGQIQTFIP